MRGGGVETLNERLKRLPILDRRKRIVFRLAERLKKPRKRSGPGYDQTPYCIHGPKRGFSVLTTMTVSHSNVRLLPIAITARYESAVRVKKIVAQVVADRRFLLRKVGAQLVLRVASRYPKRKRSSTVKTAMPSKRSGGVDESNQGRSGQHRVCLLAWNVLERSESPGG